MPIYHSDGTISGSVDGMRSMAPVGPKSRRRCHCGCKGRATHRGLGDGLCLTTGCELFIRRWVRDGMSAVIAAYRGRTSADHRPG